MNRFLLLILLLTSAISAAGQTSTLRGRVISMPDSTAMVGATVIVNGGIQHAMSDMDGRFVVKDVRFGDKIPVSFTFIGYKTINDTIIVNKSITDLGTIIMYENSSEISTVVVEAQAPMAIMRGDTTQFNAAAFKTHPDADVENLISKMPGIVIQEGRVETQGEPVRRIYVDGKLFFGDDVSTALKSLPADAVESIQIFDEQTDQAKYTGFDDGETQKAINIVTRSKRETNFLARAEASVGVDTDKPRSARFLTGGNASRFGKDYRLTVTALVNNVNSSRFATDDVTGTAAVSGRERDNNGNLLNQPLGISTVGAFGINFSKDTKKLKFSGDYFYKSDDNSYERHGETNYYPTPKYAERYSRSDRHFTGNAYQHRLTFKLQYHTQWWSFILSPTLRYNRTFGNQLDETLLSYAEPYSRNKTRIVYGNELMAANGNMFIARRFMKKGRSLSINVNFNLSDRDNARHQADDYRQNFRTSSANPEGTWVNATLIDRQTPQVNTGTIVKFKLAYTEPIGKYHRLMFSGTFGIDNGLSDKHSWNYNPRTGMFDSVDVRQVNRLSRKYMSGQGGLGYVFRKGHWQVTASIDYASHRQLVDNTWLKMVPRQGQTKADSLTTVSQDGRSSFSDLQPLFALRYTLAKTKYLRLEYRGRSILPRADQLQNTLNDNNPNDLRTGNPNLKQGYEHRLTLFYNVANIKKSTNLTVSLQGSAISDFIAQQTVMLDGTPLPEYDFTPKKGALLRRPVNMDGYKRLQLNSTYSFPFRLIKSNVNVSGSYMFIRTPTFYYSEGFSNIHTGGIRIGISSNISENVDFNIYSSTLVNYNRNTDDIEATYINQNTFASVNIIFPGRIVLNTLFSWKIFHNNYADIFNDNLYLLNVGIGRRLFKSNTGEFRITVYDILNQNRNILHYVRNDSTDDATTNTIGRYVMARFSYRFNTMNKRYVTTRQARIKAAGNTKVKDVKNNKKKR